MDTWRNNNETVTSKQRRGVVTVTLLSRRVPAGILPSVSYHVVLSSCQKAVNATFAATGANEDFSGAAISGW